MKRTSLFLLTALIGTLVFWGGSKTLANELAGPKPSKPYIAPEQKSPFQSELVSAQEEIKDDPENTTLLQRYAALLETAAMHSKKVEYIIELEQVYRDIIRLAPDDSIQEKERLADLRFSMKDFAESAELYRTILAQQPHDTKTRGRLASALTFLGEFDKAIAELEALLKAEPESFQGHAYLAITYAQMGEKEKAKQVGKKAIQLAPSDEAKKRFTVFLASLEEAQKKPAADAALPKKEGPPALLTYLEENEITREKFTASLVEGDTITIYFMDFPMQAMPPFAKEKFFSKIKAATSGSGLKRVLIVDTNSSKELASLALSD